MRSSTNRGFTLLEVMVALMIFAISISSMLSSMSEGASLTYDSKDLLKAALLAEEVMQDVEIDLAKEGFSDETVENKGDFKGDGYERFYWIEKRKKIELPDDVGAMSKMFGGDNEQQQGVMSMLGGFIQTIMQIFESSIREIEVEVYWFDDDDEREEDRNSFKLVTHVISLANMGKSTGLNNMLNALTGKSSSKSSSSSSSSSKTSSTGGR